MTTATARRPQVQPKVIEVPEWFRLRDENPLTGRPYAHARWHMLPPYVSDAVELVYGLTSSKWDNLLRAERLSEELDCRQAISLRRFKTAVRARGDRIPPRASEPGGVSGVCADCWGTCASHDYDGTVTGKVGGVFLCGCTGYDL